MPITYDNWIVVNHYDHLEKDKTDWLYKQEQGFVDSLDGVTLQQIAQARKASFSSTLKKYIL